ncbi:hypothetical protein VTN77DRAFT_1494 [Rasamsonia byssochlamydoides]|uniref:uncharacterized protein n=1 Tax=Rasamsonia byssochlamydoides TaxID=89139 RepID=UPI00374379F5
MRPLKSCDEVKIFTPIGMLGYGLREDHLWTALDDGVDAIIADSGSTDSGPQKLALGHTTVPREAYERDLDLLLAACHLHRVPVLIGSAGGDGANEHVDLFVEIITDLIARKGYRSMKIVTIYAEIEKDLVRSSLEQGDVAPCSKAVPPLKPSDIDDATRIVAQMGLEPYVQAMREHPDFDIIVGGRAYDPAPYAAFCVYHGFTNLGIAYHMGKIMECGALCSTPKSSAALATVRKDSFDIVPLDPASRCTVTSVAAHTLYEKTRPDILIGPGGALHLEAATYEQLPDNRTVRVRGGRFDPAETYTVKLEGARVLGYRATFFGGFRDPILISQLDNFLRRVKEYVKSRVSYPFGLEFHQYGRNAVMGSLEPDADILPKEVGICGEVWAPTQQQATHVSSIARLACVHGPYPHQLATAGNLAMPFPPFDIPMGEVCEFCIYHVLPVTDPVRLFPISQRTIEGAGRFSQPKTLPINQNPNEEAKATAQASAITASSKRPFLKPDPPEGFSYLGDIAAVIRTKNAGPYELTMDVMFDEEEVFQTVKKSNVLSVDTITRLYRIPEEDVIACLFWDQARAFKATIKRPNVSGKFGDVDMHGSQQHVPLMYLQVPISRDWI